MKIDHVQFIAENIEFNEKGERWQLADYQRVVLGLMFVRHYLIRIWSEIKKSGKTFLAACIVIVEVMSRPNAEAICIANDYEQAQSRVFATAAALFEKNPKLKTSVVKITQSDIRLTNGSVIKAVASDYKGAAGGRQILTVCDELWAFDQERMTRLFEELSPPITEQDAYILIVSYAGHSGESTVLEKLYERGINGKRLSKRLPIYTDGGLFMFWSTTGRHPWHTKKYFDEQRKLLRPNTFKRLHENQWVSAESQFISAEQWDACVDQSHSPILFGATVHMGVDIGVKSDTSAVVGVTWDERGKKTVVAFHKVWRPTKGQPVALDDVKESIHDICERHAVQSILADPSQCFLLIQQLGKKGITITEFPQTVANTVKMGETLFSSVKDRNLIAYPSAELREHVLNAVGIETPGGVRMVKGKTSKKIDGAIALSMALVAAVSAGPGADISQLLEMNAGAPERTMSDWNLFVDGPFSNTERTGVRFWDL
jgi:phage terminase large subunit-like protein